ncbi:sigma-70 family RNA polymerase sigma factor [Hymenobacter properus]|uniref:RNA polymerase sigma factor n=1 Tax=Hymenobacter properus TaxID=2791026 RepID=A0A931BIB5_9BACT|nr:sigma-70 family RNA polymerase sigma factor [Hymenobacter properus]MBF9141877.1 sigma-70 family RNA polymerase sigma factor [Hymenobacter properus]MBR7720685.1 sigma-70 family RNA polymerase sigma factor [Microvirga sp. SRT04]
MTPSVPNPAQWLDRYGDELFRFALSRVSDTTVAEELVQETFLSALDGLATFRAEASERTWLFVILRRKIIDHYRRQARSTRVGLEEVEAGGPTEADFFNPENGHWTNAQAPVSWLNADAALEQQELHEVLARCQARLPAQQSAVFAMRFVEELSAEEICQELGLTASNYWVLVHRAKLQLRRCLEKHGLGKN